MSFSSDFRHSLLEGRAKGKCCRAAFVSGYLTGAGTVFDGAVRMNYVDPEAAAVLSEYLPAFDRAATIRTEGERRVKMMTVTGSAALDLVSDPAPAFPEFRCNLCKANYLAFVTSIVTVPDFGFGINPLGPRILAILPICPIISGVATQTSKSNQFCWIFAIISSPPT